jgi:hypothetical protein
MERVGEWYSREGLSGTTALSEETKAKMKVLVGDDQQKGALNL